MLDFRMETFLAVCRYMNFTRAAEKLNITQPAVSQHIRFLEKHYNTKLFRYEGKKLELTEAGEILKNASLTMMHDETAMQDEMKRAGESEELRFGATRTVGDVLGGKMIFNYLEMYPNAHIHMIVENTRELLKKLDEGEIDFALVEGFFKKNQGRLLLHPDFQKYSEEPYIAVCSPDYPFKKKPKRIEDLFGERILIREDGSGTREVLERYLESCNLSIGNFRQTGEIGSMHTIKELTKLKCGITFLYETAIWEELESEALVKIPLEDFHIVREFTFIWRRGSFYADKYREKFGYFSK